MTQIKEEKFREWFKHQRKNKALPSIAKLSLELELGEGTIKRYLQKMEEEEGSVKIYIAVGKLLEVVKL